MSLQRRLGYLQPLRWIGRDQVPFTDLGQTRVAVLAGLLSILFSYLFCISLNFFFMNSQERFRVGAFAGGSAAELPSLEEELAQVF